jgi:hypothetical protein
MADPEAPEAPPSRAGKGIGSKLTKKLGPLPVWGWAIGVAGLAFLGYRYWSSKQAAASSSTAATAVGAGTTATGAPTDSSGGGGGGYSSGGSGQLATLLTTLQTQLANGGAGTGSQPGYSLLANNAAIQAVRNAGQQLYEQLTPGVFTQYNGGVPTQAAIEAGDSTPLYALSNGTVQSMTPSGTPAGVSGAAAPTTTSESPTTPATAASPAAAVATTTPSPAVTPVTSGPTIVSGVGTSLGGVPAGSGTAMAPLGVPATGPLPASGPLV